MRSPTPIRSISGSAVGIVALGTGVALLGWLIFHESHTPACIASSGGAPAINEAIARFAKQGGEIRLGPGVFRCTEPVVINASRISLRGSGPATVLYLEDKADCPVLIIGDIADKPRFKVSGVQVSDLAIDGNRENQSAECWNGECDSGSASAIRSSGLVIRGAEDILVDRIDIARCRSGGLVTEKGCRRLTVSHLTARDHEFDGLACYETSDSLFTHLHLHHNKAAGISLDTHFDGNLIANAFLTENGTHGIFMRDSCNNSFQGVVIRDNGKEGVFVDQADGKADTAAKRNSFIGMHISGSGRHAFRINHQNCRDNLIDGSQFTGEHGGLSEATPGLAKFESAYDR